MTTIEIRVFKGEYISLREDGTYNNENWKVSLDERMYRKFLKYLPAQGFCKVEVLGVYDIKDGVKTEMMHEFKNKYAAEIKNTLNPPVEKKPDVEDLIRRLEALEQENKNLKNEKVAAPIQADYAKPLSSYNKGELIEYGATLGLELTEDMRRVDMMSEIKLAKKS